MSKLHDYLLPMLYKKNSSGKIQQWKIWVSGTTIHTEFGQVDGKLQTTSDKIKSGKNEGRENATTIREQACKESKASWTKKKKSGYVESIKDAKAGATDKIIEGGIVPMLAKKYEDVFKNKDTDDLRKVILKVKAEKLLLEDGVFVQPKLDGIRCIATVVEGEVSLWSRTRKRITSCPHIEESITTMCEDKDIMNIVFDGELYLHNYSKDFEKIVSAVRKDEPTKESENIEYHIYDLANDERCFGERYEDLVRYGISDNWQLRLVDTFNADNVSEIMSLQAKFIEHGYEGAMIRLPGMGYENKRHHQLLKLKTFEDAEFKIVGVEEGRGKLAGHAGAFVCTTKQGKKFNVKMSGDTAKLKDYLEDFSYYKGKLLTVKYQGLTSDGIPRFPVGVRIRDNGL